MTEIRFWLEDWEHQCCGDQRKVGDAITVNLSLSGSVEPTDEDPQVIAHQDGSMLLIGETVDAGSRPGSLVNFGSVQFGVPGRHWLLPGQRVRCEGKLFESRHGDPGVGRITGEATGMISGMCWHQATFDRLGERRWKISGFDGENRIDSTDDKSLRSTVTIRSELERLGLDPDAFRAPTSVGRVSLSGESAHPDEPPDAWAFQFILEVSKQTGRSQLVV